jgi:ATP-dependent RNA helicase UAP56/SUB2
MFSATFKDSTKDVAKMFMRDPFEFYIDDDSKLTLHGLQQYFVKLDENEKIKKLIDLLDDLEFNQVIVFTKKMEYAKKLNQIIQAEKFPSVACFSSMSMPERLKVYNQYKEGKYRIMVCTDLLGRGIDIEKINIVINYDMPNESDQYLHRVGRAGRYGTKGLAISFVSSADDQKVLDEVQARFEVKVQDLPAAIDKSTYMNN